jgi:prepilin-type N-terminal cleavage/methylation domain-containing protein/prepilin-type processing-associated H-X9-DG protein
MNMSLRHTPKNAFTLVELLVVCAIIGVLIAMILPAVQSARESARRATCASHLSQLIVGIHQYEQAQLLYPPGTLAEKSPIDNLPNDNHLNWIAHILPYRDQQVLYKTIDQSVSVYDAKNAAARAHGPKMVSCPSSSFPNIGYSDFAAAHHDQEAAIDEQNNGVFFLNSKLGYDDLDDGASTTLFLGEKRTDAYDLGWLSGTRATLRNGGAVVNWLNYRDGLPRPGKSGFGNPAEVTPETKPTEFVPPKVEEPLPEPGDFPPGPGPPPGPYFPEPSTPPPGPYDPAYGPGPAGPGFDEPPPPKPTPPKPLPPFNDPKYVGGFASAHPQGMNAAFGDGSVRFLSSTVSHQMLQTLIHRKDGKLAQVP